MPKRFAVAFDGSTSASRTLEFIKVSALLSGLTAIVVMVGAQSAQRLCQLEEAGQMLTKAGFNVQTHLIVGEPNVVLPALVQQQDAHLLVMGAIEHSWLRQLVSGSTTSALLRASDAPVLIVR